MYAFDPARRDKPTDPLAPFVESITFHEPVGQQAQGDHEQPLRGGKPTIREMSDSEGWSHEDPKSKTPRVTTVHKRTISFTYFA
jgi:hypothetical protein